METLSRNAPLTGARRLQFADNLKKPIVPLWHSGKYPPDKIAIFLGGMQRVPRGNAPMAQSASAEAATFAVRGGWVTANTHACKGAPVALAPFPRGWPFFLKWLAHSPTC